LLDDVPQIASGLSQKSPLKYIKLGESIET
jgi:hypothetical protein